MNAELDSKSQDIQMPAECAKWRIKWHLEKFHDGEDAPYEVVEVDKNLLMYGGVSCLWQCLIGGGTGTAGMNLTYFNNANAAIGVGDSTTAAAASQTDLQASTNKLRNGMVSSFPQQTDGVISSAAQIVFQASFSNAQANYAWNEVAVFNSPTLATGRMLNRLVQSFGTKAGA